MEDISQDHIQMANKHGKLVKSFFIHKMQNKMLWSYHYTRGWLKLYRLMTPRRG